jgi:hypothetical protein
MNGERFDVESCGPSRLVFGSLTVNADTGLFDLMSLLPTGLPKLDGLASLQTFAGQVVTLDLAGNRLCVDSAVDSSKIREMVPLPIRIAHSAGGAGLDVFIRIEGSSGPLWFELDSANLDNVLIADRVLGQLGLSQPQLESLRDHQPTPIALRIGALGPLNVTATGRDLIYDGALNADTLERLIVVLDLKAASGWVSLRSESS